MSKPQKVIEADKFVLRDSHGCVRAELAIDDDDNPSLRLYDGKGMARVSVELEGSKSGMELSHPRIQIFDRDGKPALQLSDGALFVNEEGRTRIELDIPSILTS